MASPREQLSQSELRAAELGFKQLLRRKRFPGAFIDSHAADLLAQARLEYARHVASGDEIVSPAGWIIHCAWRRTQNRLEQESRAPNTVSIGDDGALAWDLATPEDEVLEADRHRKVREAVKRLPAEERRVIALTYFEGMSVREASRTLEWDKCKGDRRHRSAVKRLHELLGVEDANALQIEIGAAAWASLAAVERTGLHLPAPVHAAIDTASRGIAELIGRGGELARRIATGGASEGGMGAAAAGARTAEVGGGGLLAACTAGVCGAAAVTCLATGVLGPGVGGIDVAGHSDRDRPAAVRGATAQAPPAQPLAPTSRALTMPAPSAGAKRGKSASHPAKRGDAERRVSGERTASAPASPTTASSRQVGEEFDPFTGSESSGVETSPLNTGSTSDRTSGGTTTGAPSPPARARQVEVEFGF